MKGECMEKAALKKGWCYLLTGSTRVRFFESDQSPVSVQGLAHCLPRGTLHISWLRAERLPDRIPEQMRMKDESQREKRGEMRVRKRERERERGGVIAEIISLMSGQKHLDNIMESNYNRKCLICEQSCLSVCVLRRKS